MFTRLNCAPICWLVLMAACCWFTSAHGQSETPGAPVVLERRIYDQGDHDLILERVQPPPPAAPVPEAAPQEPANQPMPVRLPVLQMLGLSCAVHDSGLTELRWWDHGIEFHAWSNLDFNRVRQLGKFEWQGEGYLIFLAIDPQQQTAESAPLPQAATVLASAESSEARFVITQPLNQQPAAAQLKALTALHRFYDANKTALAAAALNHQAAEQARLAELERSPEPPKDVTVRFWPVQSRLHSVSPTPDTSITDPAP